MGLRLENLSLSFGENEVLRSVSHDFPIGKLSLLTAPSGAGKTSLLRMLMGFLSPDSGKLSGIPTEISAVFPENRLLSGCTPAGNVRLLLPDCPDAVLAAAFSAVGISPAEQKQPVSTFSSGMQRRVAIVRAVLAPFSLLLLDEPFSGLDTDTKRLVADWMRPYLAGKTVILVTHFPEEERLLGDPASHLVLPVK